MRSAVASAARSSRFAAHAARDRPRATRDRARSTRACAQRVRRRPACDTRPSAPASRSRRRRHSTHPPEAAVMIVAVVELAARGRRRCAARRGASRPGVAHRVLPVVAALAARQQALEIAEDDAVALVRETARLRGSSASVRCASGGSSASATTAAAPARSARADRATRARAPRSPRAAPPRHDARARRSAFHRCGSSVFFGFRRCRSRMCSSRSCCSSTVFGACVSRSCARCVFGKRDHVADRLRARHERRRCGRGRKRCRRAAARRTAGPRAGSRTSPAPRPRRC